MNRFFIRIFTILVLAVFAFSCKTAKVSDSDQYEGKSVYTPKTVAQAHSDWTDVTINGKVDIGMSSTVVVKMIKGKSLSISLRPILGMEMGKLYFEGDTVTVVDKYHKAYLKESIGSFIGEFVNVETLQSLFLARPFIIGGEALNNSNYKNFAYSKPVGNTWTIYPKKQNALYKYLYEMVGNNVMSLSLNINNVDYKMTYSNYLATSNGEMPSSVMARIPMSGKIVPLDITYRSFKWNTGVEDGITIPRSAKRYSFHEILKLITQM